MLMVMLMLYNVMYVYIHTYTLSILWGFRHHETKAISPVGNGDTMGHNRSYSRYDSWVCLLDIHEMVTEPIQ